MIRLARASSILGVSPHAITKLRRQDDAKDDILSSRISESVTSGLCKTALSSSALDVDKWRSKLNKGSIKN